MSYRVGDRVIINDVVGTVVPNTKLPGDICIKWDNGEFSSYDAIFLDEHAYIQIGGAFSEEFKKEEGLLKKLKRLEDENGAYIFEIDDLKEEIAGLRETIERYVEKYGELDDPP